MLLAMDIGNTNITLGVFEGDTLKATWRVFTDPHRLSDEYSALLQTLFPLKGISYQDVHAVIICSVVPPLTSTFDELCRGYFGVTPMVVSTGTRTGIRVMYDNPRDVGADRIVDSLAALKLYGGPVIVVDFGTATVFDAVSVGGEYLGGAIAPGVNVAAEALYLNTAQLRRVELARPQTAIGKNTIASLQSGLFTGHLAMIEGMVNRFREEMGEGVKVIGTGGLAPLFAKETNVFHAVNIELTLVGLRLVYELNHPETS